MTSSPMKRAATLLWTAAFLAAPSLPAAAAGDPQTLTGNFMSGFQDRVKPLRAVFTPTDERTYDVVFYFEFNGRNHEYVGTASGGLGEGELEGRVENESGRRTFTFRGRFDKGVLDGTHAEIGSRGERKTGTLTLKVARGKG